ncbi:MAG: FecR domain-containing protein [Candidatus Riflebacteria bacterium]|nr:FecR domain-containing protein [Candidatus Riflebacteria bacterium]
MSQFCEKIAENLLEGKTLSEKELQHINKCSECITVRKNFQFLSSMESLFPPDSSKLVDKIQKSIECLDSPSRTSKIIPVPESSRFSIATKKLTLTVVLIIVFLIAAKFYFVPISFEKKPETSIPEQRTSEEKQIILPMNNIAFLPDGSSYQVQSTAECKIHNRSIDLFSGTIHFSVKPSGKPFFVKTPLGTISVIGTDFSVDVTNNTLKVVVFSGKVRVESCDGSFKLLSKGEIFTCTNSNPVKKSGSATSAPVFDSSGDADFPNSK